MKGSLLLSLWGLCFILAGTIGLLEYDKSDTHVGIILVAISVLVKAVESKNR